MANGDKKKWEPADYAIAATLAAPFVFDIVAWRKDWKTASIRFGDFLEDPKTRTVVVASWAVLTAHLFMKLPLPGQKTAKQVVTYNLNKKKEGK